MVYNPKTFFPHAALLHQGFPHCAISPTAASRRSLGRLSVPMWPFNLSVRLLIVDLVGRYPTNYLISFRCLNLSFRVFSALTFANVFIFILILLELRVPKIRHTSLYFTLLVCLVLFNFQGPISLPLFQGSSTTLTHYTQFVK